MAKYRKKPVVIEAVQWDGKADTANSFIGDGYGKDWFFDDDEKRLIIVTLEGHMTGDVGDWIIKGIKGEFYPCKPDIFEKSYELVTD